MPPSNGSKGNSMGEWPLDPLDEDTEHGVDMRKSPFDAKGFIKGTGPHRFDWANDLVLPIIGACIFYIAWRYWGLPWGIIKEILFHD